MTFPSVSGKRDAEHAECCMKRHVRVIQIDEKRVGGGFPNSPDSSFRGVVCDSCQQKMRDTASGMFLGSEGAWMHLSSMYVLASCVIKSTCMQAHGWVAALAAAACRFLNKADDICTSSPFQKECSIWGPAGGDQLL